MGLRIRTNTASQAVQKNLQELNNKTSKTMSQLSSGKRITKAADDSAGLAIATNLNAQNKGLRQAVRNANDGMSMVQVSEGGLNEISNIVVRLRELSVQAASDTLGEDERGFLDLEYQELVSEVDRISESTTFNSTKLLNGEGDGELDFQVGIHGDDSSKITFDSASADASSGSLDISGTGVADKGDATSAMESLDMALTQVSGYRANLGAVQNRLQSSIANLETQSVNQEQARSAIEDVDVAQASSEAAANNISQQAAISTLSQANGISNSALRLIG